MTLGMRSGAVDSKKCRAGQKGPLIFVDLLIVMGEDLTKKGFITKARGAHRKPLAEVIL
jgi:hypothetical protein